MPLNAFAPIAERNLITHDRTKRVLNPVRSPWLTIHRPVVTPTF
ncbi:hypothetical protein [Oculatella sp. LEGE 06141]|nr:hypothetical protein [Oculatella sp. LEGE 06141]